MILTNTNLSIQSIMGIIMMVGISVSYGNILIDRINNLIKDRGKQEPACSDSGYSITRFTLRDGPVQTPRPHVKGTSVLASTSLQHRRWSI